MVLRPDSSGGTVNTTPLSPGQRLVQVNARIKTLRELLALNFEQAVAQGVMDRYQVLNSPEEFKKLQTLWTNELGGLLVIQRQLAQQVDRQEAPQVNNRVEAERASAVAARALDPKNPKELVTNVGMVTEAYLSPLRSFRQAFNLGSNNRPAKITSADELWKTSVGHKGLIQTFVPRDGLRDVSFDAFLPADVKANTQKRWGFQFHYNPGSVDMTYAGIPDIDVGFVASGQDPFNLVGTQVSQSSISFQLILNRVFDMQYYTKAGRLRADAPPSVYSPSRPSETDQLAIYNRGTMYDVEFFLSTILGFRAATQFRGNTADLGWIGGHPVELHLGNSLRYLAMTQGAALRHIIFNERMVPTFSTLSLTFNRIPDYSAGAAKDIAQGINTKTPAAPAPPGAGGGSGGFLRPI